MLTEDEKRPNHRKQFDDEEVEAELNDYPYQKEEKLTKISICQITISRLLNIIEILNK